MAGLVPAIHVFSCRDTGKTWMPGTRPGMTKTLEHFDAFDIVVVRFSTTDRLAEKRRPALVISNRKLPFGLIWMAMITSADNAPWSCDVTMPTSHARACPHHPWCGPEDRLHRTIADRTPCRKARQSDGKRRGAEEGILGK
jgi:PemK-like, MazF-like toxin of type II toxin-antitoxin system